MSVRSRDPDAVPGAVPALWLRVFGSLEVRRAGERVPLPQSRKTRALLLYLAVTGRPHSRDHLCDLLWDGPDDPRGGLRWSLAKLRPLLDDGTGSCLVTQGDEVALDLARLHSDISRMRALEAAWATRGALDARDFEEGATALAGALAEGLEVGGAPRFGAWCAGERERWHGVRRAVWRARSAGAAGNRARQLQLVHEWLQVDPLDEDAHATVIRALADLGRGRDALRHYDACSAMLCAEPRAHPATTDAAFARLRAADSKVLLAWSLVRLAEGARARGDEDATLKYAREACEAATTVGRWSLAGEAWALASEAACALSLDADDLPAGFPDASGLSARALQVVARARAALTTHAHTRRVRNGGRDPGGSQVA